MRKHTAAAAVLATLILSSCGKSSGPDLPKDYKDYLDYTFDGAYTVNSEPEESTDDQGYISRSWEITYKDKNGTEHSDKLKTTYLESYDKDTLRSESDWSVLNFVLAQETRVLEDEILTLLKEQFPDMEETESDSDIYYSGDGYDLDFSITRLEGIFGTDTNVFGDLLSPSDGERYSTCDLKSCASGKFMALHIVVDADSGKTEETKQKLQALEKAYTEYTGSPQNYCFELYGPDDTDVDHFEICRMLGETATASEFEPGSIYSRLGGDYTDRAEAL